MDIQTLKIAEIYPAKYNPRKDLKPTDKEYIKLANSIDAFGFNEPLVVNVRDGKNVIVAGHQRYKVLKDRGDKDVKCVVVDYDETTEKAFNLASNKIGGDWEFSALADLLTELNTGAFDMELTGFDDKELKKMMDWTPELDDGYSKKIIPPIYEPKGKQPAIKELYDDTKTVELIREIDNAGLDFGISEFLKTAAQRHTAFHFGNIAEYYCHASSEVQNLMEKSAMIIIDYNKAIEYGFVHLVEELKALAKEEESEDA